VRRYLTPRCIRLHVTLLIVLPLFALLTLWQYHRATGGNTLSWAYTILWPLFGVYAVYVWWQLIHDEPAMRRSRSSRVAAGDAHEGAVADHERPGWALGDHGDPAAPAVAGERVGGGRAASDAGDDDADERMDAYNRYLARLSAADDRKER
jgi:hypothetical protein